MSLESNGTVGVHRFGCCDLDPCMVVHHENFSGVLAFSLEFIPCLLSEKIWIGGEKIEHNIKPKTHMFK